MDHNTYLYPHDTNDPQDFFMHLNFFITYGYVNLPRIQMSCDNSYEMKDCYCH